MLTMIELRNYEFVTVTGADALAFLQGQVTCDIEKLNRNKALAGAICSLKGRVIADFLLVLDGEDCVLRTQKGMAEIIKDTLSKYAIFSQVELSIETRFSKIKFQSVTFILFFSCFFWLSSIVFGSFIFGVLLRCRSN